MPRRRRRSLPASSGSTCQDAPALTASPPGAEYASVTLVPVSSDRRPVTCTRRYSGAALKTSVRLFSPPLPRHRFTP